MSLFNPPSPPDPNAGIVSGGQIASQQQGYNTGAGVSSQAGSMVNQYNPFGSLQFTQSGTGPGGVPMWSSNIQLSPQQQQLFDLLQGSKGTAGAQAQSLLNQANYGGSNPSDVIGNSTSGLTADLMKKQTDYYQPFFNTERDQLDTKLKNQGLMPGQPAYDNAMRQLDTNHSLAVTQAAAQFEPQAYQQAFQNYNLPAQLAQALAGFGAPGSVNQDLVNAPALNIQPANLTGAVANQNQMLQNQYQNQLGQYQNMMSGVMGIPTAILGGWARGGGVQQLAGRFGGSQF